MLSNMLATLFYGTLILFIFIKIYNIVLVKKYNCKALYKEQRNKIKQTKWGKVLRITSIIACIITIACIPYAIVNFYFSLTFMIVGKDYKLIDFFNMIPIIGYSIYIIIITYKLYVNILLNKNLKEQKTKLYDVN